MSVRLVPVAILLAALQAAAQQPAVFRSRADIVTVDVHVLDKSGAPIADLKPGDFVVTVDGKPRRAVVADFVSTGTSVPVAPALPAAPPAAPEIPEATLAPDGPTAGRTILLVVDQGNIRSGDAHFAMEAALTLVNGADPRDRIGIVTIPTASVGVEPTTDRAPVRQALARINGHHVPVETMLPQARSVGITEAFVVQNDARAWTRLVERECTGQGGAQVVPGCEQELQILVRALAADVRQRMVDSARALTAAIGALSRLPGPKTMVLVSQELSVPNVLGERKDFEFVTTAMSEAAARAQVSVYVLQLHLPLFDVSSQAHPANASADADDRSSGLETVTSITGGRRLMVSGRAEPAFARILRETSAFYVVGFEAEGPDRDGKRHTVSVKVARKGAEVRARREFVFNDQAQDALAALAPGARKEPAAQRAEPPLAPQPAALPPAAAAPPGRDARPSPPVAAASTVEDAMARAGAYVVDYGEQMAMVVGIERYAQSFVASAGAQPLARQLVSEFALVRVKDDWTGYRDVFEVNGKSLRDRRDRLQSLLIDRSPSTLDEARRIADESARYNAGAIQRNFNVPTTALFFLQLKNQWRFTYRKDGEEQIDGEPVWSIHYEEQGRPTIIRTSGGRDMPLRGTLWISPVDGRVLRTHMELSAPPPAGSAPKPAGDASGAPVAKGTSTPTAAPLSPRTDSVAGITVSYKRDERLGMLLPAEMRETYEGPWIARTTGEDALARITCVATYSDFKRLETGGRVVIPK